MDQTLSNIIPRRQKKILQLVGKQMYMPETGKFGNIFRRFANNSWFCVICECRLPVRKAIKLHDKDNRHIYLLEQHEAIYKEHYKNKSSAVDRTSIDHKFQNTLDGVKDRPLVGVEYILELLAEDGKSIYTCTLCDLKCTPIEHLSSHRHIMMYVQTHFKCAHRHFGTQKVKEIKEEHKLVLEKLAWAIEKSFGRLKPHQLTIREFNVNTAKHTKAVRKRKHFNESHGQTFEDLVVEELARVKDGGLSKMAENEVTSTTFVEIEQKDEQSVFDLPYNTEEYKAPIEKSEPFSTTEYKEYEEKLVFYHKMAEAIEEDMNEVLLRHRQTPEDHPQYNEEWKKFWKRRHMELLEEGKDPFTYNYNPEWKEFWDELVLKLHNEEIESKKIEVKKMLGLLDEPISPPSSPVMNSNRKVVLLDDYADYCQNETRESFMGINSNQDSYKSRTESSGRKSPLIKISPSRFGDFSFHREDLPPTYSPPPSPSLSCGKRSPLLKIPPSGSADFLSCVRRSPLLKAIPSQSRDSPHPHRYSPCLNRDSPDRNKTSFNSPRVSPSCLEDSPTGRRYSPLRCDDSPCLNRDSPSTHSRPRVSPSWSQDSPTRRRDSPVLNRDSPSRSRNSSSRRRDSPSLRKGSPTRRRYSPSSHSGPRVSPSRSKDSPTRRRDSPVVNRNSPSRSRNSSSRRRDSPSRRKDSPTRRRYSPFGGKESPSRGRYSPSNRRVSPLRRRVSPLRRRVSPLRRRASPLRRSDPSSSRSISPYCHRDKKKRESPMRRKSSPTRSRRRSRSIEKTSENTRKRKRDNYNTSEGIDIKLVVVLRQLITLEDKLGSLGPRVIDLSCDARTMENEKSNSSEELLDIESNCILFESVREKLEDKLESGLVGDAQEKIYKNALSNVEAIIRRAKRRKRQKRQELSENVLVVPGVGVMDKEKISLQIVNTLLAQGKRDITQGELDEMIRVLATKDVSQPVTGYVSANTESYQKKPMSREFNKKDLYSPFSMVNSISKTRNEEINSSPRSKKRQKVKFKIEETRKQENSNANNRGFTNALYNYNKFEHTGTSKFSSDKRATSQSSSTRQPLLYYQHLLKGGSLSNQPMAAGSNFEWRGAQTELSPPGHMSTEMTGIRGGNVDFKDGLSSHRVGQNVNLGGFVNSNSSCKLIPTSFAGHFISDTDRNINIRRPMQNRRPVGNLVNININQ